MFQNTVTKVDASTSTNEGRLNEVSMLTVDVTKVDVCVSTNEIARTMDSAISMTDLTVVCAACTQTETRYVMTTNHSMTIKSWVF
jgi:hypothetical protein